MRFTQRHFTLWLAGVCLGAMLGRGADKNGVSPNTISVPTGPGAIEGLGESFQPTLNTGTAKHAIPLKLPPATAGHAPRLSLRYEGGGGNGPLGYSWSLPIPSIQRQSDEGIPLYADQVSTPVAALIDRPDTFVNELREELTPVEGGFYFCKNEGPFIRYRRTDGHWEAHVPDGTRLEFGVTPQGRIADGATGRVFGWLLERETDTHGNTIVYRYGAFPDEPNRNQKYIQTVTYGPGAPPWTNFHFVHFEYEDRPDWFEDCRAGFPVRTGKRLKTIRIGTQGPTLAGHQVGDLNLDGLPDYLNRRYDLAYLQYAGSASHWSLLASVQLVGADGLTALPPATFDYTVCHPPEQIAAAGSAIGGLNEPPLVMDNEEVDLVDLNADGLPDVLRTSMGGGPHQVYLNDGPTTVNGQPVIRWRPPVEVAGDPRAWTVNLQSRLDIAHLADMDGDGISDLVYKSAVGDVYYFDNQHLAWGPRQLMSVLDFAPPSPFGSADVRSADLDFDKRMDIIQSVDTGGGADYRIWFNLGNREYSRSVTVPQTNGRLFSGAGVQIADLNGDRVPDIARVHPGGVEVTAGLGYGAFAAPVSVVLPDVVLEVEHAAKARLTDLTGDGLVDLVVERPAPGRLWFWINLGNYTLSRRHEIIGLPTGSGVNAIVRWADLNGNGTTDLIYADSTWSPRLQAVDLGLLLGYGGTPNLLTSIANGIGRTTEIEYRSSTEFALADAVTGRPWPDPMPFPVTVVSAVTTRDSLGHSYVTRFQYHDGYYDSAEKQFRGFARVEQIDLGDPTAPTLITRSHFDTGRRHEALKGKLLRLTAEAEGGLPFWDEVTTWTDPPRTLNVGTNNEPVVYAHPLAQARTLTELGQGTPRRLETEFAYDDYGNETMHAEYGIVEVGDRSAFDDERVITTQFGFNFQDWLLRFPVRIEVADEHGQVVSRKEMFYDDASFSEDNFARISAGDLTAIREWIDPENPNGSVRTVRTLYDRYGNPIRLHDPLAVATGGETDFTAGHVRSLDYDSEFHTYPVRETLHLGHDEEPLVFQAAYDPGLGTVLQTVDFDGHATTYGYDGLARLLRVIEPYDTAAYPTREYAYVLASPHGESNLINYVETMELDRLPDTAVSHRDHYHISRRFVDGLGRSLMAKQEADPDPESGRPRVVVQDALGYNARQALKFVVQPFYSTLEGQTVDARLAFEAIESGSWEGLFEEDDQWVRRTLLNAPRTATEYDATLRPVRQIKADGTFSRNDYQPLITSAFDENDTDPSSPFQGTAKTSHRDGLGRLTQVDDLVRLDDDGTPVSDLRSWTTRYAYDLNDQLVTLTDAQGNRRRMTHDGLRRLVRVEDPDRGVVSFQYDDASNTVEIRDANNRARTFTYDGMNRLLTEDFHDEDDPLSSGYRYNPVLPVTLSNRADVVYFYDTPQVDLPNGDGTVATAENTKGRLAYVWDLSGEEHTSNDARGRIQYVVKRVAYPTTTALASYRTGFDYDAMDRLTRVEYPDGDQVTYQYGTRSVVSRITRMPATVIVSNLTYTAAGAIQSLWCGNGVRTLYRYDRRLRPASMLTQEPHANLPVLHLDYQLDAASRIQSITDLRLADLVPTNRAPPTTQIFRFDDLYRLTGVQYVETVSGKPPKQIEEIDYLYDRIGNLLSQSTDTTDSQTGSLRSDAREMSYGGTGGRHNRLGRAVGDPPGPHALSGIVRTVDGRIETEPWHYDDRGNTTRGAGVTNRWDLRDRLVASETAKGRERYVYDFADRRIVKQRFRPDDHRAPAPRTLYVGRYFEVDDRAVPVKYVFLGEKRMARLVGQPPLSGSVQRFELVPGWNLISLSLRVPDLGAQLFGANVTVAVAAAFAYDPSTRAWRALSSQDPGEFPSVLWIQTLTAGTLALRGQTPERLPSPEAGGEGEFIGVGPFGVVHLDALEPSTAAWVFDPDAQSWSRLGSVPFPAVSPGPVVVPAGMAFFAKAEPRQLFPTEPDKPTVLFYHHDLFNTVRCVTDQDGVVVEEESYTPYGVTRTRMGPVSAIGRYRYTGKEQDELTGFYYFGKRFYMPSVARFASPDPKFLSLGHLTEDERTRALLNPMAHNLYTLGHGDPVGFSDPSGLDVVIAYGEVFDEQGKDVGEAAASAFRQQLIDEGLEADDIRVVRAEAVGQAVADITAEGGVVSAAVFVGHGTPGEIKVAKGEWAQLHQFAERAGVQKGGVVAFVACRTMNTQAPEGGRTARFAKSVLAQRGIQAIGFTRRMKVYETGYIKPKAGTKTPVKITSMVPDEADSPSSGQERMTIGQYILEAERRAANARLEDP